MTKMCVKQKANLHNEFHLVLTDSRTGKVKQEAWAYNILLNRFISKMFEVMDSGGTGTDSRKLIRTTSDWGVGGYIQVGGGTGVLDPTRTTLFSYLDDEQTDFHDREYDWDNRMSSYTQVAVWDETQLQNTDITEVGLSNDGTNITTHALIEDSEGNSITVQKGEWDILTVYSTVFMEISSPYSSLDGFALISGPEGTRGNSFLNMLYINAGFRDNYMDLYTGRNGQLPDEFDGPVKREIWVYQMEHDSIAADWKRVYSYRLSSHQSNRLTGIWEIGAEHNYSRHYAEFDDVTEVGVFRSTMPLSGIWDSFTIEDEELGEGDGTEDEFNFHWSFFVLDSETVYVDGQEQTRDTDYTAHDGVGTRDGKDLISVYSNLKAHAGEDSLYSVERVVNGDTSDYCEIVEENIDGTYTDPPWIVFDSRVINHAEQLRIYQGTTDARSIKGFKFQGSSDGENWVNVVDDEVPNTTGWHEFPFGSEESYRYWRLLIETSHGTWNAVRIYQVEFASTRAHITFTDGNEPGSNDAVTGDYNVEFIPKDENHVLDVEFTVQFSDANA